MDEPIVTSSNTILTKPYFHIDEQEILLPNKKTVTYYTVVRKPIVAVLPIIKEKQMIHVYLVSQYRTMLGKRMLEVVAGHMDEGEKPLRAAKRELKEETGIDAFQWEQLRIIEASASVIRSEIHFYLAKDLEIAVAEPDEDEDITIVKLPLHDAIKKVMMGEINTATSMLGILLLEKLHLRKKI